MKNKTILYNKWLGIRFKILMMLGKVKAVKDDYRPNRTLSYKEEFDAFNITKYNTQFPWENHNKRMVTDKNIQVENGIARFMVKHEPGYIDGWWGRSYYDFTVAELNTMGKFSQMYGRFECKARTSNIKGLWPAFWTLTNTYRHINAPTDEVEFKDKGAEVIKPEIDILEVFDNGKKSFSCVGCSYHYGLDYTTPRSKRTSSYLSLVNLNDDWHVYSAEWSTEKIEWFIDDILVKVVYFSELTYDEMPNRPMYFIVGIGVRESLFNNLTKLPSSIDVDWIRVYK